MLLKKANTITTPTAYSNGFLHSVKPEIILGEELVTNGDFSNGTNNWTPNANATLSVEDGKLKVSISGAASGYPSQSITTEVGKKYKVTANGYIGTSSRLALYNDADGQFNNLYSDGVFDFTFVATSTSTQLRLYVYDDGAYGLWDNVSVKEKLDADFTFTRNSSATRVNELGYIEDVQIIGGELVSNGDFEQIGSELITNGSFDTDSDWSKLNSTISGGKGNLDGTGVTSMLYQGILTNGLFYKATFTISDYNSIGNADIINASGTPYYVISGEGTFTIYFKHTDASNNFYFRARNGAILSIDNVSVKEVGQDWTFGTGWTMGDGKAVCNGSQTSNSELYQASVFTVGNLYRLSFDVLDYSAGNVRIRCGTNSDSFKFANGTYSVEMVAQGDAFLRIQADANFVGSIDNISVKEVTDDTNLPRINYEGFTYENGLPVPYSGKGHLLLEGQRTNIIPYSEDISQFDQLQTAVISSQVISPDGSQNADLLRETTVNNYHSCREILTVTSGMQYTFSFFAKKKDYNYVQYSRTADGGSYANFNIANGTLGNNSGADILNHQIEDYGNGWYRCIVSFNTATTSSGFGITLIQNDVSSRYETYLGDGSSGTYIWGAQVEQGTYATSYIPTLYGTSVTRLGETCNNATQSYPSEGVLYAEIAALANDGTIRYLGMSDGTSNNRVVILYDGTADRIRGIVSGGGTKHFDDTEYVTSALDFHKVAIRYKDNDYSLWVDGVLAASASSGSAPTGIDRLEYDLNSGGPFYSKSKMIATFPYLSNDEMECLTGEGYGTFEALAAAYSYTII